MSKIVVVTGGAGFIGSHLVDSLINDGYEVVCVDNLITGKKDNVAQYEGREGFTFVNQDVSKKVPDIKKADYVFHLASPASPKDYEKYPLETAHANTLGTENMLKQAQKLNAKFLLASTSEIYGDPQEHPQKETYWGNTNSFGPRSCYDESKRYAETLTYIYLNNFGVDARIIRIFNTYGPRMRKNDGRVISNFINQALMKEDITIYGDGSQTRSFCYVTDMVDGIKKTMFEEGTKGEVFNLGNPEEYSIKELAEKIKEMTSSESNIVYKDLPQDDPTKRRPDISKAQRVLNWQPEIVIDEGLKGTTAYYKGLK